MDFLREHVTALVLLQILYGSFFKVRIFVKQIILSSQILSTVLNDSVSLQNRNRNVSVSQKHYPATSLSRKETWPDQAALRLAQKAHWPPGRENESQGQTWNTTDMVAKKWKDGKRRFKEVNCKMPWQTRSRKWRKKWMITFLGWENKIETTNKQKWSQYRTWFVGKRDLCQY